MEKSERIRIKIEIDQALRILINYKDYVNERQWEDLDEIKMSIWQTLHPND